MIETAEIAAAAERIAPHVVRTPLFESESLSERHGAEIAIKSEHLQATGSFKVRGSANVVHSLAADFAAAGVVTASSGNHGIGVATSAASRGVPCTIFLPETASAAKVAHIRRLGAEIVFVDGSDANAAEAAARDHVAATGLAYVSPYNDPAVIAGQGTIGKEILEDGTLPDAVVVAVGGGGLISGIASWIKAVAPTVRVIGASAAHDRAMAASIEAGELITPEFLPTFSDGTAGGIEDGSITFEICRALVDEWIDIEEIDIARAVAAMIDDHHQLVEGAAGVALAAATQYAEGHAGARVVAVSCGSNVSSKVMQEMLALANA